MSFFLIGLLWNGARERDRLGGERWVYTWEEYDWDVVSLAFSVSPQLHMGKQAEEQQKYGERVKIPLSSHPFISVVIVCVRQFLRVLFQILIPAVHSSRTPLLYMLFFILLYVICLFFVPPQLAYLQSSLDKLSEAIKLAKGQPDSVQEALRFTMDVIGGKLVLVTAFECSLSLISTALTLLKDVCCFFFWFRFNSAKKDNDFIYHEVVPSLETLPSVKGILGFSLSRL